MPPDDPKTSAGGENARSLVPLLETARLRLRRHLARDLDPCWRMWSDPQTIEFMSKRSFARGDVWRRMLGYAGLWSFLDFGYWAVQDKATGDFVGEVGFADFRRDLTPLLDGAPEAGWMIVPWAHGRGYATEAVGAILSWADMTLAASHVFALIHPDNAASLRIAEKFGFREHLRAMMGDDPVILFERQIGGLRPTPAQIM